MKERRIDLFLASMSVAAGDFIRFMIDLSMYATASLFAGAAFFYVWSRFSSWMRILAFPSALIGFLLGFYLVLMLIIPIFCRRVEPGSYPINDRRALPWIFSDSVVRMLERSFMRGYIKDFSLPRNIIYRMLGAKIEGNFMMGVDVYILDPWVTQIGKGAKLGSFSVVCGHTVEGESVEIGRIKIGRGAIIGGRAMLMPGVEVGRGAIVGFGAVVTKNTLIPEGEVWAGVPARKIGEVNSSGSKRQK